MACKIEFSKRAMRELQRTINYLVENWPKRITLKFIGKLYNKLQIISEYPQSFPLSHHRRQIRRCVVAKQVSIYYKFSGTEVKIIFFFDNRQSPDKLEP